MSIADNIARVEEQIAAACRRARRPRDSVQLMAVSKTHPAESSWKLSPAAFVCLAKIACRNMQANSRVKAAGIFSGAQPASFH